MHIFSQDIAYHNPFKNIEAVTFAEQATQKTLQQLSLKDKVKLIAGNKYFKLKTGLSFITKGHLSNASMTNLNIKDLPDLIFTDGPRGITTNPQTNFPAAIARAATWNTELEIKVGNAMAIEARYKGANLIGAPCINLLRHPSNGRAQESYGEDPYLTGIFGVALIKGIQQYGVMACIKHFALNSIENTRYHVDVQVDERTLNEVYLPHFKQCIDAGVASVMTAYNKVNGQYSAENLQLKNILRNDWQFKGFTQSDWDLGVRSTAASILAQLDIEMPMPRFYTYKNVKTTLDNKKILEKDIDKLVYNTLFTRYLFYYINKSKSIETPDYIEHLALSKQAAAEATVLLKNENDMLPLDSNKIKSILLVGRLANTKNDGDVGSSGVKTKVITPLQAFQTYGKEHNINIYFYDDNKKSELDSLAKKVDAVIVLTGLNHEDEGEYISTKDEDKADPYKLANGVLKKMGRAGDRYNLSLYDDEIALIKRVSSINKNTIVYLIGGSAITIEEWKNNVDAIFYSGYYGMNGAQTIPEILFGNINPSGKLPFTIPVSNQQLPNFPILPKEIKYDYYHGYTLLDKQKETPAFAFGFGLSYTDFLIQPKPLTKNTLSEQDNLEIEIAVKNTGESFGAEVVQAYIHFDKCKEIDRAEKLLKSFQKVFLQPKEEKIITLKIPVSALAYFDVTTKNWKIEKTDYSIEIGNSSKSRQSSTLSFSVK